MCLRGQRNFTDAVIAIFVASVFCILIWNLTSFNIYESRHEEVSESAYTKKPSIACTSCNYSGRQSPNASEYRHRVFETDKELLRHAFHQAIEGPGPGPPRIAFLFIVRGPIPQEPVWRKFFQGHEDLRSLYVHASDQSYKFPNGSLFEGTEIPSKPVQRTSISLVDAIRRLLAYALADPRYNNVWFVNVCESSVPIRGFLAVYEYLLGSNHSFVDSFWPEESFQQWETLPEFPILELRKGETWMQMTRKHAIIVITDKVLYAKFAANCTVMCNPDEEYFQTLLHIEDPGGIANRTTMFVDWKRPRWDLGSPHTFGPANVSEWLFKDIQKKIRETDGLKHDSAYESGTSPFCEYNGNPKAECFLFARKFDPLTASAILDVVTSLPGF